MENPLVMFEKVFPQNGGERLGGGGRNINRLIYHPGNDYKLHVHIYMSLLHLMKLKVNL